ncbi:hypothetical protein SBC1_78300 (plasmid) [Caballeronia sp. SBC1]|uniref:DUF748 domain-containing protein n=1 Tax=unclassified Caballeronia TaxID=2646786 RepID=UPI0013E1160D|nr:MULTISPECIES: DUF748 domain-containing protein [unclassified Caballeronia]QIE29499.1 hypothetical protein SBC2_75750 [Caballeronia sp. SBC2]QIN67783.1 hypothetical protein SBC1_78300 [Caballeronia sp. SBC1]
MAALTGRHAVLGASGLIALVLLVGMVGWRFAVSEIKNRILEMLGPLGTVERIDIGVSTVTLTRVHLRASHDWPVGDTFKAERIVLEFDKHALLSRRIRFRHVAVDDYYLAVERTNDGRLRLLPNLRMIVREADGQSVAAAKRANEDKLVDHLDLRKGSVEFLDQSVQKPGYRIVITDALAHFDHIQFPQLDGATSFQMTGTLVGRSHTGKVSCRGWIEMSSADSEIQATLQNVDISRLDPYLFQKGGAIAEVHSGTIDLTLDATVKNLHLHAPGKFTLSNLELAGNGNSHPIETFLSIPKNAAVAALKDHRGQIHQRFELNGNLRDPKFSLNESLQTQIAAGFIKGLGSGAEGVAKGAGEAIKSVGHALLNLLPK